MLELIRVSPGWRVDASYFLIWNLYLMIFDPLKTVRGMPGFGEVIQSDDASLIIQDVEFIRSNAEGVSRSRGRDYVSATSVAIALGGIAEELQTTKLQIWGPLREKADE